MKQQTLHIDPEFKAQIPPLTEDECKQLEENILAVLAENAERQKTFALHRTDPNPDKVSRLIDIQAKLASGKGAGLRALGQGIQSQAVVQIGGAFVRTWCAHRNGIA